MPNTPDPNHPHNVNPRDPKGSTGATLNPTRDHVQGEPEGGGEATSPPQRPVPPSPPPAPPPPAPAHHDDKSSHKSR